MFLETKESVKPSVTTCFAENGLSRIAVVASSIVVMDWIVAFSATRFDASTLSACSHSRRTSITE